MTPARSCRTTGNTSTDHLPTGCTPAPCLSSGVYKFAYSLNDSTIAISPQNTVTAASGSGDLNLTIGDWGTNNLYVEAIDGAGNVSQEFDYAFYVPWNPSQVARPGDIDGDGKPDLLATTSTGGLSLYPGNITTTWPAYEGSVQTSW